MQLPSALANLDQLNDAHWTSDGAPRLDVLAKLVGAPVTRQQIRDIAPEFTRERPTVPTVPPTVATPAPAAPAPEPAAAAPAAPVAPPAADEELTAPPAEPVAPAEPEGVRRLRVVNERIADLQHARARIDSELVTLTAEQATLQRFAPKTGYDPTDDQLARMSYLEAEQARRIKRATEAPVAPSSAAPIDRAHARRNARGNTRPTFPAAPPLPR